MSRSSTERHAVAAKLAKKKSAETQSAVLQYDLVWQDSDWRCALRRRLQNWFSRNARDLPWRRTPTLYRVWVSEIMCQQTQVATVIPYFERFLDAFPDIASLAAAEEQTLLSLWEGLGYYRRARSMHAAAKKIMEQHGGEFPESFEEVIDLPGVGRYTAGAILSVTVPETTKKSACRGLAGSGITPSRMTSYRGDANAAPISIAQHASPH